MWAHFALACLFSIRPPTASGQVPDSVSALADLSLEELMEIRVTTVSKHDERLFDAAAAVQVVTQEDIRRSGATSIPEVLRLVPGIQVNRYSASDFVVTSRGFGDVFANKLLVLIDGRSLYSPLYGGVKWEEHQLLLEDIDRVEVIRGPGAALWGANAVNGVINIVTLESRETQETLVSLQGAAGDASRIAARIGGTGAGGYWRAHAQHFSHPGFEDENGDEFGDDLTGTQVGFRSDWSRGRSRLSVSGDAGLFEFGKVSESRDLEPPYLLRTPLEDRVTQWNAQAVWDLDRSDHSRFSARVYYDFIDRDVGEDKTEHREFDIEFQHTLTSERNELVWGLQYRRFVENLFGDFSWSMVPDRRTDELFGAFVQDHIHLSSVFHLTLGSKIEHNDYTGVEVQPGVRAAWQPTADQTVWASVSRALRTPSRVDRDVRFVAQVFPANEQLLTHVVTFGTSDFESEELLAYELGYRRRFASFSLDLAGFFNDYQNVRTQRTGRPSLQDGPFGPYMLVPIYQVSESKAHSLGVEVSAKWAVSDAWRLEGAYSYLELERTHLGDAATSGDNGRSPRNQGQVRSLLNLGSEVELDLWIHYTSSIVAGGHGVPSYTRGDVRLGWSPVPGLQLDVGGKDLLEGSHLEFPLDRTFNLGSWIVPSWYGKVTWTF